MNTPKRAVSFLESFPPDIWAYFARYLPGEQLGRLIVTGAMRLWQRLKSPTVVKSIKLGEDFFIFKSFPRFLYDFPSLEELSIQSRDSDWSDGLGMKIDLLPSGLRKLELRGEWKQTTPKLFGDPGATLKLCEHVPHLEALDLSCVTMDDYSWMAHSPENLTRLILNRWDGAVALPSSLIHFEAVTIDLSSVSFVSKLPPSLESLVTFELVGVDLVLPILPPTIRKLFIGESSEYSAGASSPQNLLQRLPKSLTSFKVPSLSDISFKTNPELVALLPSTLTSLESAPVLPASTWSLLPTQITKLSLRPHDDLCTVVSKLTDDRGMQGEVKSVPFHFLPKTITSLELQRFCMNQCFCGLPGISQLAYFPLHLADLQIPDIQLSPGAAKLLPSSLTSLEIGNFCEQVCQHLPTTLRRLTSHRTMMSPNLIRYLPKSLTSLFLAVPHSFISWYDCNTGQKILSISTLPEYEIHEMCVSKQFDWKVTLPPQLMFLWLINIEGISDSFMQHQRLGNLLTLNLGSSDQLTDDSIPWISPQLTTLCLESSHMVSGQSFPFLPRCLTKLYLDSSESIFDCEIQHLPRTLTVASFNNAKHLTDLSIPNLPPHLEQLSMRHNSLITPSSYPKFPYPIRSSQRYSTAEFYKWSILRGVPRQK